MSNNELLSAMSDMLDSKLKAELQPIKDDIHGLKEDVQGLKDDVRILKEDVQVLKEDVQVLKEDVQVLKEDVRSLDRRMTKMELHIENTTDKNIQILIENVVPAAKRYMVTADKIETMEEDIVLMKAAIREHSEKIQKIS